MSVCQHIHESYGCVGENQGWSRHWLPWHHRPSEPAEGREGPFSRDFTAWERGKYPWVLEAACQLGREKGGWVEADWKEEKEDREGGAMNEKMPPSEGGGPVTWSPQPFSSSDMLLSVYGTAAHAWAGDMCSPLRESSPQGQKCDTLLARLQTC